MTNFWKFKIQKKSAILSVLWSIDPREADFKAQIFLNRHLVALAGKNKCPWPRLQMNSQLKANISLFGFLPKFLRYFS